MSQSSFPADGVATSAKWYELYRLAMLELNDAEVPQRIREARRAIFDRAEETPNQIANGRATIS